MEKIPFFSVRDESRALWRMTEFWLASGFTPREVRALKNTYFCTIVDGRIYNCVEDY